MKYQSMGSAVAILSMRIKIIENSIKNLLEIYVCENDIDKQNSLVGMIETMSKLKTYKKPKLFDELQGYYDIIDKIRSDSDSFMHEDLEYFNGCCEGIKRIIGINKELRNSVKQSFIIIYAANEYIEFTNYSAFKASENSTQIYEYTSDILPDKSYFYVTCDLNKMKELIETQDSEHEYVVLLVYNKECIHGIKNLKLLSEFYHDSLYFVKEEKKGGIVNAEKYVNEIISKMSMK